MYRYIFLNIIRNCGKCFVFHSYRIKHVCFSVIILRKITKSGHIFNAFPKARPPYSVVTGLDMSNLVSGGLELVGNSCCEHVCYQGVMPSHDANNDDAEMMIKRAETKALQIEMPTLFRYVAEALSTRRKS